jgi:S-formylglutathione hydrolase FrmB
MQIIRKTYLFLFLACIMGIHSFAQGSKILTDVSIKSEILSKDKLFNIYLPPGYDSIQQVYPVLYLLHGSGTRPDLHHRLVDGGFQGKMDSLITTGMVNPMIVVLPDAEMTFYLNNIDGEYQFEDYFIEELVPAVEKRFKCGGEKAFRGIAGLSMGGFGALLYSLHHPELFNSCASLAAAIRTDKQIEEMQYEDFLKNYKSAFGEIKRNAERVNNFWNENSILYLISNLPIERINQVNYYIDIGDDDHLYKGNSLFHIKLRDLEIPHEYRVRDGKHNGIYFRTALDYALIFTSNNFNNAMTTNKR